MDRIIQAVERLRANSYVRVDTGIRTVASETLRVRLQRDFDELGSWLAPYTLPDDYRFFLEYYGGLSFSTPTHSLDVRACSESRVTL